MHKRKKLNNAQSVLRQMANWPANADVFLAEATAGNMSALAG